MSPLPLPQSVCPPPAARQCHHWQCLSQFVHHLQPDSVTTDLASVSLSTTCSQTVSPLTLPQSVCPPPAARQCHHWHCLSQFVHHLQPDSVTTAIASVSLSTTCSQTVSPLAVPQSVCPPPAARQCTTDLASVSLSTTCSQTVSPLTLPQSVCPPPAARQCHHCHCLSHFVHHLQPDSVTTDLAPVSLSTTCSQTVSPLAVPQSVCPPPAARQCHH